MEVVPHTESPGGWPGEDFAWGLVEVVEEVEDLLLEVVERHTEDWTER